MTHNMMKYAESLNEKILEPLSFFTTHDFLVHKLQPLYEKKSVIEQIEGMFSDHHV